MQGRKHYSEKLFTHFQLSDRVPSHNFYRRLKEALDLHWLYVRTKKYYGRDGQKSIDPVVFFKLLLIGYFENLLFDRRIIDTASMRLDMLYFLGYDMDEELPWHSTISRTHQLYGEELFNELFTTVLKQCIDSGMVGGRRQAIDSALVKANASMDSLKEKEILLDGADYLNELQEEEKEPADNKDNTGDENQHSVSAVRNKAVQQHHSWKAKAYKDQPGGSKQKELPDGEQSASGEKDYLPKFVSNHTHYSTTDSDARVSVKPGKPRQLNYAAQVSVDTASHVITAIEAHHADKKDSQCLPSILDCAVTNLKAGGLHLKEVLCDAGFSSGEALKALEERGIVGYIPNFGQYKPHREGFRFNPFRNAYVCGRGVELPFKKIITTSLGYQMKQYRSSSKDCRDCPLRSTCIGKSDFKKIDDSVDKPYYDRMHRRLQSEKAKAMKKIRQSTVEPVLGTFVSFPAIKGKATPESIRETVWVVVSVEEVAVLCSYFYVEASRMCPPYFHTLYRFTVGKGHEIEFQKTVNE
ncbi:IS1182 family transposase [Pseudocnuella soli]|uniref:IS1182 family transposase n=1 Tax=Pseudocnuella soli TaxID=2502779 RepID=UPI001047917F|nr:IS1182 family transposase [Pseudocnuella soli]